MNKNIVSSLLFEIMGIILVALSIFEVINFSITNKSIRLIGSFFIALGSVWFWKVYRGQTLWESLATPHRIYIINVLGSCRSIGSSITRYFPNFILMVLGYIYIILFFATVPIQKIPKNGTLDYLHSNWRYIAISLLSLWLWVSAFPFYSNIRITNFSMSVFIISANGIDFLDENNPKPKNQISIALGALILLIATVILPTIGTYLYYSNGICGTAILLLTTLNLRERRGSFGFRAPDGIVRESDST